MSLLESRITAPFALLVCLLLSSPFLASSFTIHTNEATTLSGKDLSRDSLIVMESASNIIRFVESLALKYSNPTGGFGGGYPLKITTRSPGVAVFPGGPSSPYVGINTGGSQITGKPIQPFDLTKAMTGLRQAYQSIGKCVDFVKKLPPPATIQTSEAHQQEDLLQSVMDFIKGIRQDDTIKRFVEDVPMVKTGLEMISKLLLSIIDNVHPGIVIRNNTIGEPSPVDTLLDTFEEILKSTPDFAACMLQENLNNPGLPAIIGIYDRIASFMG